MTYQGLKDSANDGRGVTSVAKRQNPQYIFPIERVQGGLGVIHISTFISAAPIDVGTPTQGETKL